MEGSTVESSNEMAQIVSGNIPQFFICHRDVSGAKDVIAFERHKPELLSWLTTTEFEDIIDTLNQVFSKHQGYRPLYGLFSIISILLLNIPELFVPSAGKAVSISSIAKAVFLFWQMKKDVRKTVNQINETKLNDKRLMMMDPYEHGYTMLVFQVVQ